MAVDIPSWGLGFDIPYPPVSLMVLAFSVSCSSGPWLLSTFPQSLSCLLCQTSPQGKSFPFGNSVCGITKEGQKSFPDRVLAQQLWSFAGETVCTLITPLGQAFLPTAHLGLLS